MGLSRQFRLAALIIPALLAACGSPPALRSDGSEAAAKIEIVPLKSYAAVQANLMLWWVGVKGVRATSPFDCYRIIYESADGQGRPTRLSGLLALPHAQSPRGLVSYQHGTTSNRDFVPSNLDTEGLAAAVLFAGNGYATIAPDYAGLGASKGPHPYFVAADTARAVIDLIHAVRHLERVPKSPPFLTGFSEGGYASLAAQRALEAAREPVLATAAVAGAFNLRAISIPFALRGKSPEDSTYLALWVRGYATHYGEPLETAFTPKYAALVSRLFDVPRDPDEVRNALPRNPRSLFVPALLDAIDGNGNHWLTRALAENEMGDWHAVAPIRLYFGSRDVDVPPLEATTTARAMSERGSNVRAIGVGPFDHNQSILAATPQIVDWLNSLSQSTPSG